MDTLYANDKKTIFSMQHFYGRKVGHTNESFSGTQEILPVLTLFTNTKSLKYKKN